MSNSRKLKFRPVPRAPRYANCKQAEPVPLANKFQELIEQDEFPPQHTKAPVQRPVNSVPTTSMAQRLQDLLGEPPTATRRSSFDVDGDSAGVLNSRGAEFLRNDELETIDIDASDHEDWTRSSAKVGLPMAQRLDELLQGNNSRSKHNNPKQRQKGKRSFQSNFEIKRVFKQDDIEVCDNAQMDTPIHPPVITRPQTLPSIAEQFQEALMAAPALDCASAPSVQFPITQDYSTRLQKLLQLEKQQHAEISKGLPFSTPFESVQVHIMKKSLEGRLVTCKCQVIQAPSKWIRTSGVDEVQVIFNSKIAGELEIDVGCMVRINPPWRELTLLGSSSRVILCTYFCEAVY